MRQAYNTQQAGSGWKRSYAALIMSLFPLLMLWASPLLAEDEPEPEPVEVNYIAIKPSIVSNLNGGPKYIRTNIELKTTKPGGLEQVELHMPAIRHAILMLIAEQDGNTLKGRKGKKALRGKALSEVQATMTDLTGEPWVADLYFTAYYVQ